MNTFASRFMKSSAVVRDVAAETGSEATIHNPTQYDADGLIASAKAMAAKESKEMSLAINTLMKAKEDWQGGPIKVLLALQSTYSEEELNSFPVPDSDTGNNPDKFKAEVTVGDKTVMRPTTWYTQFADATPEGQAIVTRLEMVERAGKDKVTKDDIPADILEMNPHERQVHANYLTGRRATIRGAYKKAVALYNQFNLVNEMPGIAAEPIWVDGKDGEEVENTTKPIAVWQVPEEGKPIKNWEAYSIGSFMKLSVGKAMEKGGTFKALKESVTRAKAGATGNNAAATTAPAIATLETLLTRFTDVHAFMVDNVMGGKDKKDYGLLLKTLNSKGADELVTTFVEMRNALQQVCNDAKLDDKYVKLQQAGSELVTKAS